MLHSLTHNYLLAMVNQRDMIAQVCYTHRYQNTLVQCGRIKAHFTPWKLGEGLYTKCLLYIYIEREKESLLNLIYSVKIWSCLYSSLCDIKLVWLGMGHIQFFFLVFQTTVRHLCISSHVGDIYLYIFPWMANVYRYIAPIYWYYVHVLNWSLTFTILQKYILKI